MKTRELNTRRLPSYKLINRTLPLLCILFVVSCGKKIENAVAVIPDSVYLTTGDKIVAMTFDSLRNTLLSAIKDDGLDGALAFCNINAAAITDTYADSVSIRRTALRYRNSTNGPDKLEKDILTAMDGEMELVKIPKNRIVRDSAGKVHYFKPIIMQGMCLSCHGTPNTQIPSPTVLRIQELYPDDEAIDFKEGDLRGMWHIVFSARHKEGIKGND